MSINYIREFISLFSRSFSLTYGGSKLSEAIIRTILFIIIVAYISFYAGELAIGSVLFSAFAPVTDVLHISFFSIYHVNTIFIGVISSTLIHTVVLTVIILLSLRLKTTKDNVLYIALLAIRTAFMAYIMVVLLSITVLSAGLQSIGTNDGMQANIIIFYGVSFVIAVLLVINLSLKLPASIDKGGIVWNFFSFVVVFSSILFACVAINHIKPDQQVMSSGVDMNAYKRAALHITEYRMRNIVLEYNRSNSS
ncbi:hypothetical protein [Fangia hongkongensis]|uniref:hypothetical protein n=1 Tax=Fangia hongkongensis TaxID=270495 RepID=UPI000365D8B8|nr:hypothetical protein [Fangia hongkongensis]MBK2123650.1 hypothetical protein [Fangia hongkongensis]